MSAKLLPGTELQYLIKLISRLNLSRCVNSYCKILYNHRLFVLIYKKYWVLVIRLWSKSKSLLDKLSKKISSCLIFRATHPCSSCYLIVCGVNKRSIFHSKPQPSKCTLLTSDTRHLIAKKPEIRQRTVTVKIFLIPRCQNALVFQILHFSPYQGLCLIFKWVLECLPVLGLMEAFWSLSKRLRASLAVWFWFFYQSLR